MSLKDKKIVVIGGSSGIGLGVVEAALTQGAQVVVGSRKADHAGFAGGEAGRRFLPVDVCDEASLAGFFREIGPFDHLVLTPGGGVTLAEFKSMDLAAARKSFETKFWGQAAAVKQALPTLAPGGSITLTSGAASRRPTKTWAVLSSLNGAVETLGRALSVELAPVRVNVVCPGFVDTPVWNAVPEAQRKDIYSQRAEHTLVKRVGTPADLALAYLHFMENGFATGTTLVVDGGSTLL
jgi:NAD(P)-dependent dehydrogenase (short-subunit alcohol dehydrogenase family)